MIVCLIQASVSAAVTAFLSVRSLEGFSFPEKLQFRDPKWKMSLWLEMLSLGWKRHAYVRAMKCVRQKPFHREKYKRPARSWPPTHHVCKIKMQYVSNSAARGRHFAVEAYDEILFTVHTQPNGALKKHVIRGRSEKTFSVIHLHINVHVWRSQKWCVWSLAVTFPEIN